MGYSKPDSRLKIYKSMCHHNKVKNVYADILDYSYFRSKIINFKPQIIFHLAAQSLVSESYKFPLETVAANTIGTTNILDISREVKSLNSLVIVTSDNPRFEDPDEISKMITSKISKDFNFEIENDRGKAIMKAFKTLKEYEVLVIAGKGHEDYQIVGNNKEYFSDVEEVRKCLELLD